MRSAFALLLLPLIGGCGGDDAREAVASSFGDPGSARFQSVSERGDHVCGEVNGRGASGGYTGYARFVYDKRSAAALIDPRLGSEPAAARPPENSCSKTFSYQTVEERLACADRPVEMSRTNQQTAFNDLWARVCA